MTNFIAERMDAHEGPIDVGALDELRRASPPLPYVILFTARSGSTFLTHSLLNTGRLGRPHEWFNPETLDKSVSSNGRMTLVEYLAYLWKQETSVNGVFGIEMNWYQFSKLLELLDIESCFRNRIVWFSLRRRNIVAQAVSLHIADSTKIFHSYELESGMAPQGMAEYDAERISHYVSMLLKEEQKIEEYFGERSITPIELFYEEVVTDPVRTVGLFCNALRVDRSVIRFAGENPIRKIGNERNLDFEARFRSDQAAFLDTLMKVRPPLAEVIRMV